MFSKLIRTITIGTSPEDFEIGRKFVENLLTEGDVPEELVRENVLVFEALFGWLQNLMNVLGDIVAAAKISPPDEKYLVKTAKNTDNKGV